MTLPTLTPNAEPLLRVRDLSVAFADPQGRLVHAADSVSFDVQPKQVLGLVGESGCGKSATLRSLIGLSSPGRILSGEVQLNGRDLLRLGIRELERVRGSEIGMVFQDAGSALNPVLSIGAQISEVLRVKRGLGRRDAMKEAVALLDRVGIPSAARRAHEFPHQMSGGMRQRVMIALAVAPRPALLLADEPTTALDVTVQDQVLALLADLREEEGMAMVLVSHDLGVIAQECDAIAVMYAGHLVEYGSVSEVLDSTRHPYTAALMASTLPTDRIKDRQPLASISGQPPQLSDLPEGCPFIPRCGYANADCALVDMTLDKPVPEHGSACVDPERMRS
ncbi:ABC transporter ATP-binding protein [Marmoricola sp. URHA0025 HA25]